MGKIKQGILGGFSGKVGTVVGSYWNGIFYMKALPQSKRKGGKSDNKKMQQGYFKELVTLSMSLSNEDLKFIYPKKPKGMSRRNLLVKQLAELAAFVGKSKTVDLDSLSTLGNAPSTALPAVAVAVNRDDLQISWEAVTYYRDQHPDDYPVIFGGQRHAAAALPHRLQRTAESLRQTILCRRPQTLWERARRVLRLHACHQPRPLKGRIWHLVSHQTTRKATQEKEGRKGRKTALFWS